MKTKTMKITGILLTLVLLVTVLGVFALSASAADGYSGVPATPAQITSDNYHLYGFTAENWSEYDGYYAITTAEELYGWASAPGNAVLINDIDVNAEGMVEIGETNAPIKYHWVPVDSFTGTFDGRGHSISGLFTSYDSDAGFVSLLTANSTIKNLTIANSYFFGKSGAGGIACFARNGSVIENCVIAEDVKVVSEGGVGGIAQTANGAQLTNCVVLGKVYADTDNPRYVGAILSNRGDPINVTCSGCYYISGNATSENGNVFSALGYNQESDDYSGQAEGLASRSAPHTCVAMEHPETKASCYAKGSTAYTDCMICGKILSGTKSVTEISHPAYTYADKGDGTHSVTCVDCGSTYTEDHNFITDTCICGKTAAASLTNGSAVTYYGTLEEAIAAAQSADGSTVTLLTDLIQEKLLFESGNFTLDLGGKSIHAYVTIKKGTDATLTLQNGTLSASDVTYALSNDASLVLRDVSVLGKYALSNNTGACLYLEEGGVIGDTNTQKALTNHGKVYLNEGSIAVDPNNPSFSIESWADTEIANTDITGDIYVAPDGTLGFSKPLVKEYSIYLDGKIIGTEGYSLTEGDLENMYFPALSSNEIKGIVNNTVVIGALSVSLDSDTVEYNGNEQEPTVTVKIGDSLLAEGTDYSISWNSDFTSVGEKVATITLGDLFASESAALSTTVTYTIKKATPTISIDSAYLDKTYNLQKHTVSVELPAELDGQYVTVSYWKGGERLPDAPTDAGEYEVHVRIEGSPNYEDSNRIFNMTVKPADVVVEIMEINPEFVYTGGDHTPAVLVTLNGGLPFDPTEYGGTVSYENNREIGTATATVSGNFEGSCTFEIGKATPTVTVSAPLDTVMPGYVMDITGATDAIDNFLYPTTFTVVDGEGYSVSGNTITIDEGVKIGSTITVKMTSSETKNFLASEGTLTLTVGISTVDTTELEADVEELNKLIAEGGDIDQIHAKLTEITDKLTTLEQNGATDDELATAKAELAGAVSALETNLNGSIAALQGQINSNDADITDITESITAIRDLIDALEAADGALDGDISEAIAKAENELKTAQDELKNLIGNVQSDLDSAKAELDAAIADLEAAVKQDSADFSAEIADLNTALTNAKAALEKADAEQKAELVKKIEDADALLDTAIGAVEKKLDDAKAELNRAIADGDATLDGKIAAVNEALAAARAALEATDAENKSELTAKIDEAYSSLDAAIGAVQKNLDDLKAAFDAQSSELANKNAELEGKDGELQTLVTVTFVISGIALCGSGALAAWVFLDRKKKV